MILHKISILLWKEFKEISRDRKLVVTTILIPLLSLPAIGILTALLFQYQPVVMGVVNQDDQGSQILEWFTQSLVSSVTSRGYILRETLDLQSALRDVAIDLIIVIPRGFSTNLTSLDKVAYIEIIRRTGVSEERLNRAEQDLRSIVSELSTTISREKINTLANKAGVGEIDVEAVRNPIQFKLPLYIAPTGEPARPEDVIRPLVARLLILTFAFVVTPASSYIVDSIVGERERKTIEMLLVSPAGVVDVFVSKIIAASFIGLISAITDMFALLVYFNIFITVLGGVFIPIFDPVLIALHALIAFLSIQVTVAVALPFITRTRGVKTASNIAGLLSMIGLSFFISGWIIDFYRIQIGVLRLLMFIPYTHSILAIQSYVYRDYVQVLSSTLILLSLSITILTISLKTLDREKVLLAS